MAPPMALTPAGNHELVPNLIASLLANGVDIEAKDAYGFTPLH